MGLILVSFVDPGEQNRGAQAFVLVSGWGGGGCLVKQIFLFSPQTMPNYPLESRKQPTATSFSTIHQVCPGSREGKGGGGGRGY